MAISEMIGGMSQLTAVFVVLTALTGALLILLSYAFSALKQQSQRYYVRNERKWNRYIKSIRNHPVEGTIASLSMLLTAGASLVIVPLFLS